MVMGGLSVMGEEIGCGDGSDTRDTGKGRCGVRLRDKARRRRGSYQNLGCVRNIEGRKIVGKEEEVQSKAEEKEQ